jgi:hypothetical protein
VQTLFSRNQLPLSAIRGRRELVSRDAEGTTRNWLLVPIDNARPALKMEKSYNFDDDFKRWFNSLPDLDALDKQNPKKL